MVCRLRMASADPLRVAGLVVGGHVEADGEGVHGLRARPRRPAPPRRWSRSPPDRNTPSGTSDDELHPDRVRRAPRAGRPPWSGGSRGGRHAPVLGARARVRAAARRPRWSGCVAAGSRWTPSTIVWGPTTKPCHRYDATAAGSRRRGTAPLASSARTSEANSTTSSPVSPSRMDGPVERLDAHADRARGGPTRARGSHRAKAKMPRKRRTASMPQRL